MDYEKQAKYEERDMKEELRNARGEEGEAQESQPKGPGEPLVTAELPPESLSSASGKRPVSEKKLAANRANSQRSTGPTTSEGKEKSKLNAVKHGLTARCFAQIFQPGSPECEEFSRVLSLVAEHYKPVGPMEHFLVEKVAIETIRYGRLVNREQNLQHDYWAIVKLATRYQSAINRQLFEAIKEVERLQSKRKAEELAEPDSADQRDELATPTQPN